MKNIVYFLLIITMVGCASSSDQTSSLRITVNDTSFSKGRLGLHHDITLDDVERFHGHRCDGLVVGFIGLKEGLKILYPDGVIDRTNTRVVSKASPCLTDVSAYITGGRYQFNTYYVTNDIDGIFVIQRMDDGLTVRVKLKEGVIPKEIKTLGKKAVEGDISPCDLDRLKGMEDDFSATLIDNNPDDFFIVEKIDNFNWNPVLKNDYLKTDILNKNKPKCSQ